MIFYKNIKEIHLLIILFCCLLTSEAQDTLYIDIQKAVDLALNNQSNIEILGREGFSNQSKVLHPLEINYQYGQLYSLDIGWKIEASQEFQPFGQKKIDNVHQAIDNYIAESALLNTKKTESEVKVAYNTWLYFINLLDQIYKQKEYAQQALYVATVKNNLGESEPLEEALATLRTSEIETEYLECLYNIDIAENRLKGLMGSKANLRPVSINYEMYQISKKDDTSKYNGKYITDVLLSDYKLEEALTNKVKTKLRPSFEAGAFYQDIAETNGMIGFQAGIKLPIWQKSIQEEVQKAKISTERKYNEYQKAKSSAEIEINTLIYELDKKFVRIRHYQNHALPTANLLMSVNITKYEKEEIDYTEFTEKAFQSIDIKKEYLALIYEYNNIAIQLELYTK